jgi:hypothetical protein
MRGRRFAATALCLLCLGAFAAAGDATAQAKKKDDGAAKAAAAEKAAQVQSAYAAGAKAFEAGDMVGAEQGLSSALAGGGLPNSQMARALYLRGSVYRRTGRPAQAISDLTTAVWLKGGLSEADKAKATEERQLAYREAGLGDTPPPIGAAPLDGPKTASPGAPAAAPGAQVVQVTQQSFWSGISMPSISIPSLTGSPEPAQTAAAVAPGQTPPAQTSQPSGFWSFLPSLGGASPPADAAAGASDPAFATTTIAAGSDSGAPALGYAADATLVAESAPSSSWDTQTAQAAAAAPAQPQQTVASYVPPPGQDAYSPPPAAATPAPAPAASDGASSGIGAAFAGTGQAVTGFFSNMFGGGSQATAPGESAALTTGSTEGGSATWGPETTVVTSQTSSMIQRTPESPPASTPADGPLPWTSASTAAPAPAPVQVASTGRGGAYKLQVAAVRSRDEADRLAQSLRSYPAVRDGIVTAEVDETVIGSMGTFYRVRLGPYADAKEPGQLCKTLKPQGFDCLVVTQ